MILQVSVSKGMKYELYERISVQCLAKINSKVKEKNYTYSLSAATNITQEQRTVRVRTCKLLET
jgi:hypothetical protein